MTELPRRPCVARSSVTWWRSASVVCRRARALSSARSVRPGWTTAARSKIVRATLVTGMPSTRRTCVSGNEHDSRLLAGDHTVLAFRQRPELFVEIHGVKYIRRVRHFVLCTETLRF